MSKTVLPPAAGVCKECLEKNSVTNGYVIAVHCSHNQAGAVMPLNNGEPMGLWFIYTPISAQKFADMLNDVTMGVEGITGGQQSVAMH